MCIRDSLGDDRPVHVPIQCATLAEAVGWIRGAGGIAVIAHPGRYKYTPLQFAALFDEFLQLGGVGIEVNTGSHTVEEARQYADVARRYGFLASRGSDFHSPKAVSYTHLDVYKRQTQGDGASLQ